MQLASCLHPQIVVNPFTHERVSVPCGKCSVCRVSRQLLWQQRIELECDGHRYSNFVTLHYEERFVPTMVKKGNLFVDVETGVFIDPLGENLIHRKKDYRFFHDSLMIRVLRKRDYQLFFKRLRKNIDLLFKKLNITDENKKIRYYLAAEYGGTTFRPHAHIVIWHDSQTIQKYFEQLLCLSWPFDDKIDWSPIQHNRKNAAYVATYLNCLSHLPSVFQCKEIRPFFLCSKCPPIGLESQSYKDIRRLLLSGDVTVSRSKAGSTELVDLPLLRACQDSLYPLIPRFAQLSHSDRTAVYGTVLYSPCENYKELVGYLDEYVSRYPYLHTSVYFASYGFGRAASADSRCRKQKENFARHLFSISGRVTLNASLYGFTVSEYVKLIEDYYSRKELYRLKLWYEWQQEQVYEGVPVQELVFVDESFVTLAFPEFINFWLSANSNTSDFNCSFLTSSLSYQLQSYGIYTLSDLPISKENSILYKNLKSVFEKIEKANTKSKCNNDYLEAKKYKFTNEYIFHKSLD